MIVKNNKYQKEWQNAAKPLTFLNADMQLLNWHVHMLWSLPVWYSMDAY
jgi:hypothetical protein